MPSIIQTIFHLYKNRRIKTNNLKFLGYGSSILSGYAKKFKKKFNIIIKNIYGMSESGIASMDIIKSNNLYGSIGEPLSE